MDQYHLFLDESETHSSGANRVFCLAGIIVKDTDYNVSAKPRMNRIKQNIWHDQADPISIVLHEKDVRFAQNRRNNLGEIGAHFHRFRSGRYSRMLYSELNSLFATNIFTVVGASIILDDLSGHFSKDLVSDKYLIAMQILLEK